jgi:hypothetical protein
MPAGRYAHYARTKAATTGRGLLGTVDDACIVTALSGRDHLTQLPWQQRLTSIHPHPRYAEYAT